MAIRLGSLRSSDQARTLFLRVLTFAIFAGTWQWFASSSSSLLLPTFTDTIAGLVKLARVPDGQLWPALATTNQAIVLGYALSVAFSVPLGLLMARVKVIESIANPWLSVFLAMSVAPLMPLVMMALGLSLATRVAVVFLFSFVYIVINTHAGVRNVRSGFVEMATSFGASERQIWTRVLIPGALPAIMTGLRLGLGRAVMGSITIELLLVAVGIGRLMLEFRSLLQADLVFAVAIAMVIEAVILMVGLRLLERRLFPWASTFDSVAD